MVAMGFFENKFPGSGSFKTFGSSAVGFNFRHDISPSPAGIDACKCRPAKNFIRIIKNRWRELSKTGPRQRQMPNFVFRSGFVTTSSLSVDTFDLL